MPHEVDMPSVVATSAGWPGTAHTATTLPLSRPLRWTCCGLVASAATRSSTHLRSRWALYGACGSPGCCPSARPRATVRHLSTSSRFAEAISYTRPLHPCHPLQLLPHGLTCWLPLGLGRTRSAASSSGPSTSTHSHGAPDTAMYLVVAWPAGQAARAALGLGHRLHHFHITLGFDRAVRGQAGGQRLRPCSQAHVVAVLSTASHSRMLLRGTVHPRQRRSGERHC